MNNPTNAIITIAGGMPTSFNKSVVVVINMKDNEIKCVKCGHKWITKSKLGIVICASCGKKNKNKFK